MSSHFDRSAEDVLRRAGFAQSEDDGIWRRPLGVTWIDIDDEDDDG